MENGGARPEVSSRAMENGGARPEVRRAMENGGLATDLVMCSTCSGFMFRKKPTSIPKPDEEEEVVEVVTEAEKMRDLMKAVLLHGPLQEMEPADATEEQWQVLQRRRRIMMETKRCPTCCGSLIEACPTSSREEGSEFMAVLLSHGGKERKKIATEDEAMVADARSEQKLKRSREEGKRSSSGLKKKKKAKSEDKEGSGSKKKKAKRSSEMEGSGSKEAKMFYNEETKMQLTRLFTNALELLEQPPVKPKEEESAIENRKTKMVTRRMDRKSIDILKNLPPRKPLFYDKYLMTKDIVDAFNAHDAVESVLREYLQCHCCIKGYAEYQEEVTDDEGDDHKLV